MHTRFEELPNELVLKY
ncbi:unnamed protein product, partial [Rotaria sp. Silwood2]